MMRAWEARGDCAVVDEPLYAHYLLVTGVDHPGREEVLARHETDWRRVVEALVGPAPRGAAIFYQKHMAHHLVGGIRRDWIASLRNALLIRQPRAMVASLARVIPNPGIEETGLPQLERLDAWLGERTGAAAPVIDARDVLLDPPGTLRALCLSLGVGYTEKMLAWRAGGRATDGVWARHWYANVERSTGFAPYAPPEIDPPARLTPLIRACDAIYERLAGRRLNPQP